MVQFLDNVYKHPHARKGKEGRASLSASDFEAPLGICVTGFSSLFTAIARPVGEIGKE